MLARVINYFKGSAKKFLITIVIIALFLNGLYYSFLIGYFKPKLDPEEVVKIVLHNELKKEDSVVIYNVFLELPVVAYLHIPLKMITNQTSVDAARVYKNSFLANTFLNLKDVPITEESPFMKQYKRVWVISSKGDDISPIDWFTKHSAKNLKKIFYTNSYEVRLYQFQQSL